MHNFLWQCLTPNDIKLSEGNLLNAINSTFHSVDNFKEKFLEMSMNLFGSGWTFLVKDKKHGTLKIINTSNATNPLNISNVIPLFTCDLWEHAFYLDYKNNKKEYIKAVLQIINWNFIVNNFD